MHLDPIRVGEYMLERSARDREFGVPLDDACSELVDAFVGGDGETRSAIVQAMSLPRAQGLAVYGERMASAGVCEDSSVILLRGVLAVGLASTAEYDKELIPLPPTVGSTRRQPSLGS
ncbi:MAG: hypothetical protein H0U32_11620 [Thermoleophilaceae bacterium]|nr:hypothetical protein [Thermoleophilaceae bacterium]